MQLDHAIRQSQTCEEFSNIFSKNVAIQINALWGVDAVSVEGYGGTVTMDFIANAIADKFSQIAKGQEIIALKLAGQLISKIFVPLRDRVIHLDRSNCATLLLYKIRNCGRIFWTPEDRDLTARYPVLKHSMWVMFLTKSV